MELLRQVIGLEYQALALAAGPLASLGAGWGLRQALLHLRDQRAAGYVTRLVAWAEQAIPDRSARYHEVAALLSRRFPMLSGEQMEVLIESEVLGLKTALRAGERFLASGGAGAPSQSADGGRELADGGKQSAVGTPEAARPAGVPTALAAYSTDVGSSGGATAAQAGVAPPAAPSAALEPQAAPAAVGLRM